MILIYVRTIGKDTDENVHVRTIGKDTDENVQPSSNFKDFVVANETCLNLLKYLACKQNFKK